MTEKPKKPLFKIHPARGMCDECIEQGKFCDDDTVVVAYCRHNQMGGVYNIKWEVWELKGPLCEEDFIELSKATRERIRAVRRFLAEQEAAALKNSKKWN